MKQYHYNKSILVIVTCMMLSSCSHFLKTELMNQKTGDSYYQTPSDAQTALTGCYNGLDLIWNAGVAFPVASEVFSDNCLGGTGASDDLGYQVLDAQNKNIYAKEDIFLSNWEAYYQAIFRCNELIQSVPGINWNGDTTISKADCDGEAKFLRAYLYFDMVRLWENIPLLTVATTDNLPQATPDSVYAQIIADLKDAVSELPSTPVSSEPYTGHATKWAAESMLARVFLFYTGYYGKSDCAGFTKANALATVEDVITNSGHSLVANFASLWPAACTQDSISGKPVAYAGENNPEIIFSIKYTYANSNYNGGINGNTWMVMMGMRDESHYPFGQGWGACTVDPKLYAAFDMNDSRRLASIINVGSEVPEFGQNGGNGISDQREYTGYYNKKYTPMSDADGNSLAVNAGGTNFQISQYQDYFAIRYADVLLMAAELGSPKAQTYFNQVHTRAGLSPLGAAPTGTQILNERRFEFAFEGIRYWDLLRQGINTAAATIIANTTSSLLQDGTSNATGNFSSQNFITDRGFQQIPQTQITLSGGKLVQNTGW